jgi:hypothetical protein
LVVASIKYSYLNGNQTDRDYGILGKGVHTRELGSFAELNENLDEQSGTKAKKGAGS